MKKYTRDGSLVQSITRRKEKKEKKKKRNKREMPNNKQKIVSRSKKSVQ